MLTSTFECFPNLEKVKESDEFEEVTFQAISENFWHWHWRLHYMWLEYFLSSINVHIQSMFNMELWWPNICMVEASISNCTIRQGSNTCRQLFSFCQRNVWQCCSVSFFCPDIVVWLIRMEKDVESDKTELRQIEERTTNWKLDRQEI